MNKQKNGLNSNIRPGHKTRQKSIDNGHLEYNWRTLFMARSGGWSSKRFLGVLGFITSLTLLISAFKFIKLKFNMYGNASYDVEIIDVTKFHFPVVHYDLQMLYTFSEN